MFCPRCGKNLNGQPQQVHNLEAHPKKRGDRRRPNRNRLNRGKGPLRDLTTAQPQHPSDQANLAQPAPPPAQSHPPPPLPPVVPANRPASENVPPPPNPWEINGGGTWTFSQGFTEYPGGAKSWSYRWIWQPDTPQAGKVKED